METVEQKARDILERAGVDYAQSMTAGDLVEIANLIAEVERLQAAGEAATKAEREACAKMADERIYQGPDFGELANDIRSRD